MEINNIFTAKTVDEAIAKGLAELGIEKDAAEIEVLEEGKKKLFFGSIPAKIKITCKKTDGQRAAEFVDGLLEVLNIKATSELKEDGDRIEIEVVTTNSSAVIGRRGEVLDAIQNVAGAVANIGRDDYKKVVVDCENYRAAREETLKKLAEKLAKKAVEKAKRVTLEPMNPYERRIIHSALSNNTEVKTESLGREPNRYIVIVPNNCKPYEKRDRKYGDRKYSNRRENGEDGENNGEKRFERGRRNNRDRRGYGERKEGEVRNSRPARGKKEIHFGTFLGNSKDSEKGEV